MIGLTLCVWGGGVNSAQQPKGGGLGRCCPMGQGWAGGGTEYGGGMCCIVLRIVIVSA
jgi:hypothetical protein